MIFFFPSSFPTETFQRSSAIRQSVWASEPFGKRLLWANVQRRRKPKGIIQNGDFPLACGYQSSPEAPPDSCKQYRSCFVFSSSCICIPWVITFITPRASPGFPCLLSVWAWKDLIIYLILLLVWFVTLLSSMKVSSVFLYTAKHKILICGLFNNTSLWYR